MAERKKFYRTTYSFVVLSEGMPSNHHLGDFGSTLEECRTGSMVGYDFKVAPVEVSEIEMRELLIKSGSEVAFFFPEDQEGGEEG